MTDTDTFASPPEPSTELRHSGHGIASLTISLLSWVGMLILLTMQGGLTATSDVKPLPNPIEYILVKGILEPFNAWVAQFLTVLLLPLGLAFLLALGFGLAGLGQHDRDRFFAWAGCVVSALGLVTAIVMVIAITST